MQVTEKEEGMKRFSLKPFYCVLFPIVKVDGVIEYDDFCRAIREGGEPRASGRVGLEVMRVIEAAERSHVHRGLPVVPLGGTTMTLPSDAVGTADGVNTA